MNFYYVLKFKRCNETQVCFICGICTRVRSWQMFSPGKSYKLSITVQKMSIGFNGRLLTTHTPSAIGPTRNYFVSIYFERTVFADILKAVLSEFIESKLTKVDSSCITKKRRVCSSYTQLWSFLIRAWNLIRTFLYVLCEVMSGICADESVLDCKEKENES